MVTFSRLTFPWRSVFNNMTAHVRVWMLSERERERQTVKYWSGQTVCRRTVQSSKQVDRQSSKQRDTVQ